MLFETIGDRWTEVPRRTNDDLLPEVKGNIYWVDREGYKLRLIKDDKEFFYDVEFINNQWWNLERNGAYWTTRIDRKIPIQGAETSFWPDQHLNNPKYVALAQMSQQAAATAAAAQVAQAPTPRPTTPNPDTEKVGGLQEKVPEVFTEDRKESKKFILELNVYFKINRKHKDIVNQYSKTLIALSFIKGDHVVNWVNAQVLELDDKLASHCHYDKEDEHLWDNFEYNFKKTFVLSTQKEDAFVKISHLKMVKGDLDAYIAKHATLSAKLH